MRRPGARCAAWVLAAAMLTAHRAAAELPAEPAFAYQITGTVVSVRGGAPVPFCHLSAGAAGLTAASTPSGPPRFGRGAQAPGSARTGRPLSSGSTTRNQKPADEAPETQADAAGRFTLDLPHGGSWRVTAAARGFRSQAYEEHDGYYASIVLSESSHTYEAKFLLIPDSLISGLVLDETGEPVASALLTAEVIPPSLPGESRASPAARARVIGGTQTDDRGRYELPSLAPGEYRLRVQAQPWYASSVQGGGRMGAALVANVVNFSGGTLAAAAATPSPDPSLDLVYPMTWYPSSDSAAGAETITLADGEQRQADFHLAAIPASHLVVARPDPGQPEPGGGRPRPQRPVTITRVDSDGSFGQTTFIGGNGREWDFGGLAPGVYEVRLPGPNGEADGETRQIEVRAGAGGSMTLENSKPLTRVTIALDGLSASDVVAVQFLDPDTGRQINASPPQRGPRGHGGEDDEGDQGAQPSSAMAVMLPPHRYDVQVAGRSGAYVTGISAQGAKVVGRTVEIGGGSAAAVTLHLANVRGELSGTASLDGHPVSGAMVLLVPVTLGQPGELAPVLRDESNSDGSFLIQGVIPGRYILVAIDHGWDVNFRELETLTRYLSLGVPVEVKGSGKLRKEIVAVLP